MTRFNQYWPSGLVVIVAMMAACSDGVVGLTEVRDVRSPVLHIPSSDGGGSSPTARPSPTQCETLNLEARRVLSVSPEQVTLRVLASYVGPGDPYGKLLHATGERIGVYPLGDITLSLGPGDYHVLVYMEVVRPDGLIQCDGSVQL